MSADAARPLVVSQDARNRVFVVMAVPILDAAIEARSAGRAREGLSDAEQAARLRATGFCATFLEGFARFCDELGWAFLTSDAHGQLNSVKTRRAEPQGTAHYNLGEMMNSECGPPDHSWADSTDGTSLHQIATMKCRRCGVGHAIELRAVGTRTVQVDMKMFPARGSHTVSPDMMLFFMASWGETCQEIEEDGYTVVRGAPEIALPQGL
jgi:hypothetical protein